MFYVHISDGEHWDNHCDIASLRCYATDGDIGERIVDVEWTDEGGGGGLLMLSIDEAETLVARLQDAIATAKDPSQPTAFL